MSTMDLERSEKPVLEISVSSGLDLGSVIEILREEFTVEGPHDLQKGGPDVVGFLVEINLALETTILTVRAVDAIKTFIHKLREERGDNTPVSPYVHASYSDGSSITIKGPLTAEHLDQLIGRLPTFGD